MFHKVRNSITQWKQIGSPEFVLSWISQGIPLDFVHTPPAFSLKNPRLTEKEALFVDQEIKDLKRCGAIRQCRPGEIPYCVSPIKTVPKKGNQLRLIHDLREVNKYIVVPKFSNEGIDVVKNLIKCNDYMITVDLQSGFHHCHIKKEFQKYLGFYHKGFYYVWCVLPFGLKSSPYYFHKFLRPVVKYLRENNLRLVLYVDDCILMSPKKFCADHKDLLLNTFNDLGLQVNVAKSHLEFTTVIDFLGYTLDSVGSGVPELLVKKDRVRKLLRFLKSVRNQTTVKVRKLAQIAGQCISMTKAVLPGKLLLRNVYRVIKTRLSWNSHVFLDQGSLADLNWWYEALNNWNGAPIKVHNIDAQLTTDASSDGWGALLNGQAASGLWNSRVGHCSSNERELLAIHMAILSFHKELRNKTVQVLTDNISACAYINSLGGPSPKLTQLMKALWIDCAELGITLTAKHLAGILNVGADRLSRRSRPYEWRLHTELFNLIDDRFGPHTIDRFASLTTTQLPKYNSLHADPLSSGVDALAQQDWKNEMNYVNAPFFLIPKVLQTIQQQRAEATIIAPLWPAQPWYNDLLRMAVRPPILLPKNPRTMIKTGAKLAEPLKNPKWQILAWRVSGKTN